MTLDAVVTEWLPAASRRALDAASCAPAALAALSGIGTLATVTVLFPTLQEIGRREASRLEVRWRSVESGPPARQAAPLPGDNR